MKKGAWKYFRPGDDYADFMAFIDKYVGPLVEPNTDITDPADETWTFKKKIRIVIDIFDEEN
jgi:hypothetical protein